MFINILFDICSLILLSSALAVILARNPVHSVLFLILTFFNASILFLLSGAEFLAMMLLVVYVGAVLVLFLFIVMMLNVDFVILRNSFTSYMPISIVLAFVMLVELLFAFTTHNFYAKPLTTIIAPESNIERIGKLLYTDYAFYFELSGLLLLIAMISSIVLTLHHRNNVKRQSIAEQVLRDKDNSIEIKQVISGQGIE